MIISGPSYCLQYAPISYVSYDCIVLIRLATVVLFFKIPAMETASGLNNEAAPPASSDGANKFLNRFQYVFDNAKNDNKAPVYCKGLFKGYLAFDTGQPFHYRVSCPNQRTFTIGASISVQLTSVYFVRIQLLFNIGNYNLRVRVKDHLAFKIFSAAIQLA